jgi:hypothetical protein
VRIPFTEDVSSALPLCVRNDQALGVALALTGRPLM